MMDCQSTLRLTALNIEHCGREDISDMLVSLCFPASSSAETRNPDSNIPAGDASHELCVCKYLRPLTAALSLFESGGRGDKSCGRLAEPNENSRIRSLSSRNTTTHTTNPADF